MFTKRGLEVTCMKEIALSDAIPSNSNFSLEQRFHTTPTKHSIVLVHTDSKGP